MYKVCHISSAHPQEDIRIFKKECISLAEAGYEVVLITRGKDQYKEGVNFFGLGDNPSNRLKRILIFTYKAYKKAIEIDADLYHFHDPELLPYALKMAKRGKKVIFDSHEFTAVQIAGGVREYIPKPIQSFVSRVYQKYERMVTNRIDGVVIPCLRRGRDYFEGNYKRIAYVNNVPRISEYMYSPDLQKDERTTCYVGSITKERGIINTIKGSYKAGCQLQLIGEMDQSLLEELKKMSEFEAVTYYGKLPVEEFTKIINRSTVGICLLKNIGQYDEGDNLSTKVYEYMAMGIPIVASDFRMNKRIIEGHNCGICVDPDDIDSIADAISTICCNKQLSQTMSLNGRKLATLRYSWEIEKTNLLNLYAEILK